MSVCQTIIIIQIVLSVVNVHTIRFQNSNYSMVIVYKYKTLL